MTDDFNRLRGVMSDLAEHGGSPDLYERTLHRSRRLRRRGAMAAATGSVAAVVAAIGGAVALLGGTSNPTLPPPGGQSPSTSSTTPTPTPSRPPTTPPTSARPDKGCPVSASTLNDVPGLPNGYRVAADTVQCWRNWASGWDHDQTGDGAYLFQYTQERGWRIHSQGSAFDCDTLGIPKDPDDPPPFCSYGDG